MTRITRINREKFEAPKEGEPGPKCFITGVTVEYCHINRGHKAKLELQCFDEENIEKLQNLTYANRGEVTLEPVSKAPKPKKERTKERFKSDKTKMRTRNGDTVELNDEGEIEESSMTSSPDAVSLLNYIGVPCPEIDPLADLKTKIRTFELK